MFSALKHFAHLGVLTDPESDEPQYQKGELREDGTFELREDGTFELRE